MKSLLLIPTLLASSLMVCPTVLASETRFESQTVALRLPPTESNPRNSEGDFIQLKDGRILFVYTHFTGGGSDHATAHLAGRYSSDDGKAWDAEDTAMFENEAQMNIMSFTLFDDPDGWYCYTAMPFTPDALLLGHCAGDRATNSGLELGPRTRASNARRSRVSNWTK